MEAAVSKVFTAPNAYITMGGKVAGYCRNISFSENITRANVQGLGSLTLQEAPAVLYTCQWSASQYFLDFNTEVMRRILFKYGSAEQIKNSLTLGDMSFELAIYSKIKAGGGANVGELVTSITPDGKGIAILGKCMVNTHSLQLQEGGIAGIDVTGIYLEPITIA